MLKKRKFDLRTKVAVKEVKEGEVILSNGESIECGLVVWSTGISPGKFIKSLEDYPKDFSFWNGRLLMDEKMRLLRPGSAKDGQGYFSPHKDIFGLGDCAVSNEIPLPTLGAVAKRQAHYLAKNFNNGTMEDPKKPFKYVKILQMTALGSGEGLVDPTISALGDKAPVIKGLQGKLIWMTAYWGLQVSNANKMLIPLFWFKSWLFGRDISRF